ncbi:hypothetical protein UFOVP671_42 [uncultured Caudovirales phage]|uniref:Uncharacterized protein n=1 Tax=uncultured Caudovirales phage TaxID=2100421 RepID=A0A6J5NAK2_9CAUD|nr:hypothetical protein UFOVP671_42 [uncultured Caudovirales phage]
MKIDPKLKEFATPKQAEIIDKINETGMTYRALAKHLGMKDHKPLFNMVKRAEANAAKRGYSPIHGWDTVVPEGYIIKGISQFNKDSMKWVKSMLDPAAQNEARKHAIEAMKDEIPKITVSHSPPSCQINSDIVPWIQIGDAHMGMLAHASETCSNFDIKIATQEICDAIYILINDMPFCERMVINDLGDFTHYTNFEGLSKSGHQFDFDTRFPKMVKAAVHVMRFIVEECLKKANHVDVILNLGNHSLENDVWMNILIKTAYEHTGRVHVLNNDNPFIGYRMGNTLVMTNHSDKTPPQRLIGVMITDFRKDFGETKFHYIDVGHWHTNYVIKEHPSVIIESFNHLAALDQWAHHKGYRSRRSMTAIIRSKKYGEIGRRILHIEEIMHRLYSKNIMDLDARDAYNPDKSSK